MLRHVLRTALSVAIVLLTAQAATAQTDLVTYYHVDATGSVRMITDVNGQVMTRYDYLPFGQDWPDPPAVQDARRFAGKERDPATGFDYFGGRYYANGSGRFTTVDPILDVEQAQVDPQRWNRYAYVTNRPLRFTDPDGRVIFDWADFRRNVSITSNFGESGYGYFLPTVAAVAAIGSVAQDAFMFAAGGELAALRYAPKALPLVASAAGNLFARATQSGLQFADQGRLDEHVGEHLREFSEFGFKSGQDYIAGANRLVDAATRGVKGVESFVRSNGDLLVYKRTTNEFAAVTKLGTLKTYFRPEKEYEYWLEQIK